MTTRGRLPFARPGPETPPPEGEDLSAEELTTRQAQAIPALLSQPTLQAAAHAAGVGERTLRRWLADDTNFVAAYQRARTEAMRQATARLQATAGDAVDTLRELLTLKDRPDLRARVALGILAAASKAEELDNLAARLEAVERLAAKGARPLLAALGREAFR